MKLTIIAAVGIDGVIGVDDIIPWHIPEDLKHFKETTMGKMLLVGHNTFTTLPKKVYEGRRFIVITRNNFNNFDPKQFFFFRNEKGVFKFLKENNDFDHVYVIGGAYIYDMFIDYSDEAIITWVNKKNRNGNKFFPVKKLFINFTAENNSEWIKSKYDYEYKIIKYLKNEN